MSSATDPCTVLVLGSGAREHALADTLARSPRVARVVVCPGHALFPDAATAPADARIVRMRCSEEEGETAEGYLEVARSVGAALTVVGPEAPLAAGVVDLFESEGLPIFGPTRAASEIETSKTFAKALMERAGVNTPRASIVTSMWDAEQALPHFPERVVVKASGLAGGKGAFICNNHVEALGRIWRLIEAEDLGVAGAAVIIENHVVGDEASVMAICDGTDCVVLPAVRDFKRVGDGDTGSNTGGMGAMSPVPGFDDEVLDKLRRTVFLPTLHALQDSGRRFSGLLYAGLMRSAGQLFVLEFNARFGDPETQVLLPRLESDLFGLLEATATRRLGAWLKDNPVVFSSRAAVGVVAAASGYPDTPRYGLPVPRLALTSDDDVRVFATGVELPDPEEGDDGEPLPIPDDGPLVNTSGRTATWVALAPTLAEARRAVYARTLARIPAGFFCRRDIAARPAAYARAGVDIDAARRLVDAAEEAIAATFNPAVLSKVGAYAGLFDLAALGRLFPDLEDPILVASNDGLGTKAMLASALGEVEHLGHDLVHHLVNDLAVTGARPLFLLDHIAANVLRPDVVGPVLRGVADACRALGIALIGGETAEMPGFFATDAVEVAGTLVGVVDRKRLIDGARIDAGDVVLGLPSSGLHTNGYSLVRALFATTGLLGPDKALVGPLLAPHRVYLPELRALESAGVDIRGLVHITGGGFIDNPPRVLPSGVAMALSAWPLPSPFDIIQARGRLSADEMRRVFNLGYGMLVIVPAAEVEAATAAVPELTRLGTIVPRGDGAPPVTFVEEPA